MNTIIRNGEVIHLTDEEVRSILNHEHEADVRYEVEQALQFYEDEGVISFSTWTEVGFAEYASLADARADFIDYVVEHILDMEDTDERTPVRFRYHPDYESEVYDTAKDCGYLTEEV